MMEHPTDELRDHLAQEPSEDLLWHYTDQAGFLGIVQTGKIWATSVTDLNDRYEFELGKQLAIARTDELRRGAASSSEIELYERLHEEAKDAGINHCVASWSAAEDDLSQWRAYARTGTGYAIGVRSRTLIACAADNDLIFGACVYEEAEQRRLIDSMVDAAVRENAKEPPSSLPYWLHRYSALLKHPAFKAEREWRLISRPTSVRQMEFRHGRSALVTYLSIALGDVAQPVPIAAVIVGPSPEQGLAARKAAFLLAKDRPSQKAGVLLSKVPYRNW